MRNPLNLFKMRYICLFILAGLIFSGCSDSRYTAEKLLWQAQQEMKRIAPGGLANLKESDYGKIRDLYQKVADTCPLEPAAARAQFLIADIYTVQGKYREAQAELVGIINNFSATPELAAQAQFSIGKLYESQGKWPSAEKEYEKLIDLYPLTNIGLTTPIYVIRYYQSLNDSEGEARAHKRAVRHYEKISGDFAETEMAPVIQDYLASLYVASGDFDKAIEVWKKTMFSFPASELAIKAFLSVADIYANGLNDIPKSIVTYEAFIEAYPKFERLGEIKIRLGLLYAQNDQIPRAIEIFDDILREHKDDPEVAVKAYAGLAYVYQTQKDTDKVIETYEMIKTRFPKRTEAIGVPFLIGQYYEQLKLSAKADLAYAAAITEYKAILESDERDERAKKEAANFLALSYIKKNKTEEALQLLRMLSEKYPENPMYLMDMATLYTNLKATDKAIATYKDLMRRYPNNRLIVGMAQSQIGALNKTLAP
jgi:tetratricopeptide (TPR) repeat protein